jgi:hypothetical protein
MMRTFVETSIFIKCWVELGLTDEDLRELQIFILKNPNAGDMIVGTGGAIKVRYAFRGKGKRGGNRVVYVDAAHSGRIHLLLCYSKGRQDDLTEKQKRLLKAYIKAIKGD